MRPGFALAFGALSWPQPPEDVQWHVRTSQRTAQRFVSAHAEAPGTDTTWSTWIAVEFFLSKVFVLPVLVVQDAGDDLAVTGTELERHVGELLSQDIHTSVAAVPGVSTAVDVSPGGGTEDTRLALGAVSFISGGFRQCADDSQARTAQLVK